MARRLQAKLNDETVFKEKRKPLTPTEKEKVQKISAAIETRKNIKLVLRCLMVAALFMCFLQSGQIVKNVDGLSSNILSDSLKIVSREWHQGMKKLGLADMKGHLTEKVQNVLPELNQKFRSTYITIKSVDGATFELRGAAHFNVGSQEIVHGEKEPRTQTVFGQYKFRGSF